MITGVSGSGKSTLAFDTLYAEGQRRFVDCLSTYARQFLQRLDRPDVDFIGEIQPPIALQQQTSIRNARSTVGSITELSDLLHLLFAHAGTPHCPRCGREMDTLAAGSAADRLRGLPPEGKHVLAAAIDLRPGRREDAAPAIAESLRRQGYDRTYRAGAVAELAPPYGSGDELLVIDRFVPRSLRRNRAVESIETAWRLGAGRALVYRLGDAEPIETLLEGTSCPACGRRGEAPRPQLFSSGSPLGACPDCKGFGRAITVDREKVVPDRSRSLLDHAVLPFSYRSGRRYQRRMLQRAREAGVPVDRPFRDLDAEQVRWVFEGDGVFRGVEGFFRRLERKRYRTHVRILLARFRGYVTCPTCAGSKRRPEALAVRIAGRSIADLEQVPIEDLRAWLAALELSPAKRRRVASVLREVGARLRYLDQVGLGYLTLGRTARTLSGGETQRIRLASGLGTSLTHTLYVLDEPTVGLHAVDTSRMLSVLRALRANGNTVVVVEHDPGIIVGADHLLVLGPSGGELGGELLYEGPVGPFLRRQPNFFRAGLDSRATSRHEERGGTRAGAGGGPGALPPPEPETGGTANPAAGSGPGGVAGAPPTIRLLGVRQHNLDIPRLEIPADRLVVVTGLSGSGKSTLIESVLHRNALRLAGKPVEDVGFAEAVAGLERFEEVLLVSQNPLGRSARSNVVTYVGLLALIRARLSRTPDARRLGLRPGSFSFNVPGGRCEVCKGMGTVTLEMHFLADVEITCEACRGRRFLEPVLEVTYRGRNILQILDLTVEEAAVFFREHREAERKLAPLLRIGLGYLKLGQSTATLSGGEAQRLKIASLLAESDRSRRPRLFLLDEPTSGLHPRDIDRLLGALRALVLRGNAVVVVEHQLDFIRAADHVIDLGPGGGNAGGRLLYSGPVEGILGVAESVTARALRETAGYFDLER